MCSTAKLLSLLLSTAASRLRSALIPIEDLKFSLVALG